MEKHELKSTSPVLKAGEGGTRMGWTRPTDGTLSTESITMVNGVFFMHSDHLGSSNVVTDTAGALKQLVDYYPYGSVHFEELGSNYDNDYLYTGKELDEELGLYDYGARYYLHPASCQPIPTNRHRKRNRRFAAFQPIPPPAASRLPDNNQKLHTKKRFPQLIFDEEGLNVRQKCCRLKYYLFRLVRLSMAS